MTPRNVALRALHGPVLVLLLLACGIAAGADTDEVKELAPPQEVLQPSIDFLANPPVIDGVLDAALQPLPRRPFCFLYKADRATPDTAGDYRLAYGTTFLYLYIDIRADGIVYRDRGYQNGDGFILILNMPQPGNKPANEYYQLAYHPTGDAQKPFAQMVWARNDDWPFSPLSDRSLFSVKSENGHVGYEVLLRWDDIPPYHPWVSDAIGFNLFFVKAIGETGVNWLAANMAPGKESDGFSAYSRLVFAKPAVTGAQSTVVLERNHLQAGDSLKLKIATVSPAATSERMRVSWVSGEGSGISGQVLSVEVPSGLSVHETSVETGDLVSGGYMFRWKSLSDGVSGQNGVTVLPAFDTAAVHRDLDAASGRIRNGSLQTLRFKLEEIGKVAAALKPYDTCPSLRAMMERLDTQVRAAVSGHDVIAEARGNVRRAFRSAVDGTLQPYTAIVPRNLEPGKKYAAILFLHGSDSDDQSVSQNVRANPAFFPEDVFVIAPLARGKSNGYTRDHAQEDIREALADALQQYPIDPSRVVLAGFSMGGYGVYRTLYEDAGRYAAAAVFSGLPHLGVEYGGEAPHPDFRKPEFLKPLRGKNIVVIHGAGDRNAPVEMTTEVVEKMKKAGVHVLFLLDKNAGHELPGDPAIQAQYLKWLNEAIREK